SRRREALFDRMNAPLSSLSAKIEIAYAAGAISEEARVGLHFVRSVRNKFAHRVEALKFDDPEIAKLIDVNGPESVRELNRSHRSKFLTTFHGLALVLYATIDADVRLKPVEETHNEQYLSALIAAMPMYAEAARTAEGKEPPAGSPPPKQE